MESYRIIIVIVALFLLSRLHTYWKAKRMECPKCKCKGHVKKLDEISLGPQFNTKEIRRNRVYYKCENCRFEWSQMEENELIDSD